MAEYHKRDGDKEFRRVFVTSSMLPGFTEFISQTVNYDGNASVLEIRRKDNTTEIISDRHISCLYWIEPATHTVKLDSSVPVQRLWIRSREHAGIWYKVPEGLPGADHFVRFQVNCDPNKIELIGDEYFQKLYDLQRG